MEYNFIRNRKNFSKFLIFKNQIKEKLRSTNHKLDFFQIQEVNKKQPKYNGCICFVLFCLVYIKVVGYKVQITFYKLQPYFYFFISIMMKYQKLKQGKNTRCNSAPRTIFCVDGGISKEKGTAKSYFTLYFFQYRFAFSTFYFGKLVFCLSVFNGFSVFS